MGGRRDLFGGRLGTSFAAKSWRSLDLCGLLGVSFSLSIHLFAFGVILCFLIEGSLIANAIFLLLYTPSILLALASLYMAWSTDPGAVPMGARPLVTVKRAPSGEIQDSGRRAIRRCHKCCDNYKPNRAHHDSVTGRCIVKFDHFCPWIGNAVGALNHKMFCLFVFYTMFSCLFSLLLIIIRALHCNSSSDKSNGDPSVEAECKTWHQNWNVFILLIVSVIFFAFTMCMLFEQVEAIKTNSSKIARMKMRVGQAGTELSRVTEEFNEMFGGDSNSVAWHWFLPLSVEFPRGMKKVVLGYEWDETFVPAPYEEPGHDEEEGRIELTTPSKSKKHLSNDQQPAISDDGEEANFVNDAPKKLIKRSNSKGSDNALNGALT